MGLKKEGKKNKISFRDYILQPRGILLAFFPTLARLCFSGTNSLSR